MGFSGAGAGLQVFEVKSRRLRIFRDIFFDECQVISRYLQRFQTEFRQVEQFPHKTTHQNMKPFLKSRHHAQQQSSKQ